MKIPEVIKLAARDLRNNMTKAEVILWKFIKNGILGEKFLRQKPIYVYTENSGLDRFIIADFYCYNKRLIIEVDGSIHNIPDVLVLDLEKEKLLNNLGIKVLRIKNEEIFDNVYNVINKIKKELEST